MQNFVNVGVFGFFWGTFPGADLHKKYQLNSRFSPKQLTESINQQVEQQEAELDQQHHRVVPGLERLRPEGGRPGRTLVPRWIQGCTVLKHTRVLHAASCEPDGNKSS